MARDNALREKMLKQRDRNKKGGLLIENKHWTKGKIRCLPSHGNVPGREYFSVFCPELKRGVTLPRTYGYDDPVYDYLETIKRTGTKDEKDAAFSYLNRTEQYWIPCIVRGDEGTPQAPNVRIFRAVRAVYDKITSWIIDESRGEDITDPKRGRDIFIEKTGEGKQTKWTADREDKCPLSAKKSMRIALLKLSKKFNVEDHFYPFELETYEQVYQGLTGQDALPDDVREKLEELDQAGGRTSDEDADDDEDDDDETPNSKRSKTKMAKKSSKSKGRKDEDIEDDEDEESDDEDDTDTDDEEDEDDEEERPSKKSKKKSKKSDDDDEDEDDEESDDDDDSDDEDDDEESDDDDEDEDDKPSKKKSKKSDDDDDEDDSDDEDEDDEDEESDDDDDEDEKPSKKKSKSKKSKKDDDEDDEESDDDDDDSDDDDEEDEEAEEAEPRVRKGKKSDDGPRKPKSSVKPKEGKPKPGSKKSVKKGVGNKIRDAARGKRK